MDFNDLEIIDYEPKPKFISKISRKKYNKKYNEKSKEERKIKGKDACRDFILKKKYKIDLKEYNKLYQEQNGKCKICGINKIDNSKSGLVIDQNHTTGQVRGLLCFGCNMFLGKIENRLDYLNNYLEYLNFYDTKYKEDSLKLISNLSG